MIHNTDFFSKLLTNIQWLIQYLLVLRGGMNGKKVVSLHTLRGGFWVWIIKTSHRRKAPEGPPGPPLIPTLGVRWLNIIFLYTTLVYGQWCTTWRGVLIFKDLLFEEKQTERRSSESRSKLKTEKLSVTNPTKKCGLRSWNCSHFRGIDWIDRFSSEIQLDFHYRLNSSMTSSLHCYKTDTML